MDMRRTDKNYHAYAVFQMIKENIVELDVNDYGYFRITYKKGLKSNNIGRWYCNKGMGIQPLCVSVRHTICDGLWVDIDQDNSHPTTLKKILINIILNHIYLKNVWMIETIFSQK